MAKQTVNIGASANDGTGDELRLDFDKLNQNNNEIYGDDFVTEAMLNDNIVGADELKVTGNGTAGQILSSDGDGTMTWITGVAGDITGVEAGAGLTGGGTGGDVTLTVVGGTGITANANDIAITAGGVGATQLASSAVTTVKINNDAVTHDKLENRYTAINAIGTTSGAFNIDFSLGAIQTATLGGAHTGTFINFKVGQVIDIIITGNHALTFSATASGTPAINKVGTTAYDGTATQIIQVQCASDDSTTPIFYYACNTYAAGTTP